MDLKMLVFHYKKIRFSEQTGFQKNDPEKMKIRGVGDGPILLPSVAPEGTHPAMLLKKLAMLAIVTNKLLITCWSSTAVPAYWSL